MDGAHNFWGRLLIVIGSCVVGLIFPLAFLLAALVAYSLYVDLKDASNKEKPLELPPEVPFFDRESNLSWRELTAYLVESPAEQAFLDAMIEEFGLRPAGNDLAGGGIHFACQREILSYRVDFIINDWLIIEIDGAAWHSSPDAVERDRLRDADLRSLEYSIVRIPAKTVFKTPLAATRRVRKALSKPTSPITVMERDRRAQAAAPKVNVLKKTADALNLINGAVDGFIGFMDEVDRRTRVEAAMKEPTAAFENEKLCIEAAIASAEFGLRPKEPLSDPEFDALLNEIRRQPISPTTIRFFEPDSTGDDELDAAVRWRFSQLRDERAAYLDDVVSRTASPALRIQFRRCLSEFVDGPVVGEISSRTEMKRSNRART